MSLHKGECARCGDGQTKEESSDMNNKRILVLFRTRKSMTLMR